MALTVNGYRTGRAGASDLADIREYIQNEQAEEAHRHRAEVKERTEKLVRDIASMMFDDEYKAWLDTTPNDNEGFLKACEVKYTELTTEPHPVDFTQAVERKIDQQLWEAEMTARHADALDEERTMREAAQ